MYHIIYLLAHLFRHLCYHAEHLSTVRWRLSEWVASHHQLLQTGHVNKTTHLMNLHNGQLVWDNGQLVRRQWSIGEKIMVKGINW